MASAFAELPTPSVHRGQRQYSRARLNLPARAVTFSGCTDCLLLDASQTGAKVAAAECPRVGAMVVIEGLPIELFGTVRWSRNKLFGIEFDTIFCEQQIIALRRHADGEAARQERAQIDYARIWAQGK